jgi:hypothetical protein
MPGKRGLVKRQRIDCQPPVELLQFAELCGDDAGDELLVNQRVQHGALPRFRLGRSRQAAGSH